jgi:hypothetical protein
MNLLWSLLAFSVLLVVAFWFGKGAVLKVGVYYFSRAVANGTSHVCDGPECPAIALLSAIEDTHRKVRTEAILAVVTALATLAGTAYIFVLLTGRLV